MSMYEDEPESPLMAQEKAKYLKGPAAINIQSTMDQLGKGGSKVSGSSLGGTAAVEDAGASGLGSSAGAADAAGAAGSTAASAAAGTDYLAAVNAVLAYA